MGKGGRWEKLERWEGREENVWKGGRRWEIAEEVEGGGGGESGREEFKKGGRVTDLVGSIDALRLTSFGASFPFSFFSHPTTFLSPVQEGRVTPLSRREWPMDLLPLVVLSL